ncbi:MAG: M3 family oligoendopeptidase [Rubrobacter sp.]|nr:M3 family oligoendopeptidase [Rubrobacter sp.]
MASQEGCRDKRNNQEDLAIPRTEWDLSPLLLGNDDPKIEREQKTIVEDTKRFVEKWKPRTDYLENPAVLREALDDYEKWLRSHGAYGDSGYYVSLRRAQDQTDPDLKAKETVLNDRGKKTTNQLRFFVLNVAQIPLNEQPAFLAYPGLSDYRHYLERQWAKAPYLLAEQSENILSRKSSTSYSNWIRMREDFFSRQEKQVLQEDGAKATKTYEEILSLTGSKNKEVRDDAGRAMSEILVDMSGICEAEINSVLEDKMTNDDLRGYARPDTSRHLQDDISTEVVDAMIAAVSGRFDISKRFYELKAQLLGLPYLHYHERNVEIGEVAKEYPYREAVDLVYESLYELDPEFGEIFADFVKNGRIDAYPRKGKRGGAFCSYDRLPTPVYILLNYTNKLRDVMTLAHETGHGINDEIMRQKQNELNFGTPTFTAEVASTFMEDFVLQNILKDANEEERFTGMLMKLDDEMSTIFRQVAFYRFEQQLHSSFREKGYLSTQEIGEVFRSNVAAYMGEQTAKGSHNWWMYVGHFRYFFYVYSYASGLLISKSLQNSVKESPRSIDNVKEFLAAGRSETPENTFGRMGVDITDERFWEAGLQEVDRLLTETEKLAARIG